MDRELLLEIGVEELPAAWLPALTKQVSEKLQARLKELRLVPDVPVESFSTPRRLTARVGRMPERQEDLDETISGPPISAAFNAAGEPTPAAIGFARKQGVAIDAIERVKTDKGEYIVARRHVRGKSTVDVLPEVLGGLLRDLSFPKQMHWDAMLEDGRGELVFGRPIRWLLYLYGGRVVPFTIGRMPGAAGTLVQEVTTGALTYGHRFLATSGRAGRSIKVRTFDEYRARLPEHFVILDHAERRDRIARELEAKARKLGGRVHLREHAALLAEVADLVEYPGVVAGFFERDFLELPQEVLTTTLVHHQHYFPVLNDKGELKEAFLAIVNTQPSDERTIAKNAERVVTARLRDAKFFWESDRRTKLDDRLERLHTVVFHKKLQAPSYRDKAQRIERLARTIASDVFAAPEQAHYAARAAKLAKADLVTDMVFEFPELQGTMGGIYAREQGEPEQIWKAISYHYLPIGVELDEPPSRKDLGDARIAWAAVSLADKIDTVTSLFVAGERPTGSRDPFGMRRAMNGVMKILIDLPELTGLDNFISLDELVRAAAGPFGTAEEPFKNWEPTNVIAYFSFWLDRLQRILEQRGFDVRNVRAVLWERQGKTFEWLKPLEARLKLEALPVVVNTPEFRQLAVAFKRVRNIARELGSADHLKAIVVETDSGPSLTDAAEIELLNAIDAQEPKIMLALEKRDYRTAFLEAARFGPSVDRFFAEVFVMVDEPKLRTARLLLMKRLETLILRLADVSEIVVESPSRT
jgi:glycyl-tRNA synthetase beta chain